MHCPNCNQHYDNGKFCAECGVPLVDDAPTPSGAAFGVGDYAAIEGGIHLSDSHNVHNEDHSVHNISNTTSTVNNITQVTAQKSEIELLQERKMVYVNACKRAYEDNVLEQSEVIELEELRIKLGLDKATADGILENVRIMSNLNARKSTLNPIAKTKLKILTDKLQKNEIKALMDQIDGLEALVRRFDNDELLRKYFLVLAALKPDKCIEQKEKSRTDSYWETFWSYLAYIKAGRMAKAESCLTSLGDFSSYPEDNITVLATAGALMRGENDEAKEFLEEVSGEYTPALQRFVDSIYFILKPEMAKEMEADEKTCAFYLVNFFKRDSNTQPKTETGDNKQQESTITGNNKQNQNQQQETDEDKLIKKWESMTAEAYRMMLEVQELDDIVSVLNMAIPPALAGITRAMLFVASGLDALEQEDEAVKWADKIMSLDPQNEDASVMEAKGAIYENGCCHYSQNSDYAIAFYRASAAKGNLDALCFVADMYYEGEKVEKNYQMALAWAKEAFEAKSAFGLYIYGRAYYEGNGVPKDSLNGKRLIREAADMKNTSYIGSILAEMYIKENLK